jgi:hypothetical protein
VCIVRNATQGVPIAQVIVRIYTATGVFVTSALTNESGAYLTSGVPRIAPREHSTRSTHQLTQFGL